jgi:hypothetical protein
VIRSGERLRAVVRKERDRATELLLRAMYGAWVPHRATARQMCPLCGGAWGASSAAKWRHVVAVCPHEECRQQRATLESPWSGRAVWSRGGEAIEWETRVREECRVAERFRRIVCSAMEAL